MRTMIISLLLLLASAVSGCTSQQAYGTGQAWQRNQCEKLPGKEDRDRCMSQASTPYDSYKRETERGEK
jgi:hypothetical protein